MQEIKGSLILVVDDDPTFRLMLRQFLQGLGAQVLEAEDGAVALEVFDKENPSMVLMDADMPVMDGIDACRVIRERDRDGTCPVLIVTSIDNDDVISKAFEAGATDYVSKPIHWAVLKQRILYLLKASRAAQALQASEERFRLLFQESPLAYQALDEHGNILEVNNAWLKLFRYRREEVIGKPFLNLLDPAEMQEATEIFDTLLRQGYVNNVHYNMISKNKNVNRIEVNGRVGRDLDGTFLQTHCMLQDDTERDRMEQELRALATTDSLTGIANRRSFFRDAEQRIMHCRRYLHPFAVLMLDLDHFKAINDQFGHDAGDEILKAVTILMRESIREVDVLGRLGGEEFGLILPETNRSDALLVAERIRTSIENFELPDRTQHIAVTASIGGACLSPKLQTLSQILKQADEQLYRAKTEGRNLVVFD